MAWVPSGRRPRCCGLRPPDLVARQFRNSSCWKRIFKREKCDIHILHFSCEFGRRYSEPCLLLNSNTLFFKKWARQCV